MQNPTPAPREGRRRFCLGFLGAGRRGGLLPRLAAGQERRYTIAFANLTDEPGVTLEGTGFTGPEVRSSFVLAARRLPVELVLYDNQRDPKKALANAEDAIARKVDLSSSTSRIPTPTPRWRRGSRRPASRSSP
jgi:ABC-type sugar transport system substrate-binding protein